MTKINIPIEFETTFDTFLADELLGQGGAGRVYGARSSHGEAVAIKVLTATATDKRRRFKNEIEFQSKARHDHIVPVLDHGVSTQKSAKGPFYIMPWYDGSLRSLMRAGIAPNDVVPLFLQVASGIEAAHLRGVTHRDLKPENIVYDATRKRLLVADFGIARFTEDQMATMVETAIDQRLANFAYAAPEQRTPGGGVAQQTDIYALGLILNEMFTGTMPHGTGYRTIGEVSRAHAFLDDLVAQMLRNDAAKRPTSLLEIRVAIAQYEQKSVASQRISNIDGTVVPGAHVDDPLALRPPTITRPSFDRGTLSLHLEPPVTDGWRYALTHEMANYEAVLGKGPTNFRFTTSGDLAWIECRPDEAQAIIDKFKTWLPKATNAYRKRLEFEAGKAERDEIARLKRLREEEETNLRVNESLRV